MKALRKIIREKSGSSITEFALMCPLVVVTIYYTMFMNDLTIFKIKTHDITRFAVFGFADRMGSDYNRDDPGSYTNQNRSKVNTQLKEVWGDFDPQTMDDSSTPWLQRRSVDVRLESNSGDLKNQESPLIVGDGQAALSEVPLEGLAGFLNSVSGVMSTVYESAGFNTKGMVVANVNVKIRNKLVPTAYQDDRFHNPVLPREFIRGIDLSNDTCSGPNTCTRLAMLVDSWKLEDGRDVQGDHRFSERVIADSGSGYDNTFYGRSSPYHKQIKRMWLGTFDPADSIPDVFGDSVAAQIAGSIVGTVLDWVLSLIPGQPFNVRLASHAYRDDWQDGMIDVFEVNDLTFSTPAVKKHHTMPMEDDPDQKSDYYEVIDKRGPYYMGCTETQDDDCKWAR